MASKGVKHEANPIETLGAGLGQALGKDLAAEGGKDFLRQLLGIDLGSSKPSSEQAPKATGSMKNGELVFSSENHKTTKQELIKRPAKAEARIEAHIDYKSQVTKTERITKQEMHAMEQDIQQILDEIQRLIHSSRTLQGKFKDVAMEKAPVEAGKYHRNRLETLRITLQLARQQVEDSAAWLNTSKSKNGKKGGYWDRAKAGANTHFTQSGERNVSTQTG